MLGGVTVSADGEEAEGYLLHVAPHRTVAQDAVEVIVVVGRFHAEMMQGREFVGMLTRLGLVDAELIQLVVAILTGGDGCGRIVDSAGDSLG